MARSITSLLKVEISRHFDVQLNMPRVKFLEHNGTAHEIEARAGANLMQTALIQKVPGIIGDCGGSCACATCHVYIEDGERIPPVDELEAQMLEQAMDVNNNSRLACQIVGKYGLDGLTIRIPSRQF